MEKGLFIVFEGIDGCGKTTQIKKFVDYLFHLSKYNHIILTRNPYKDTNIRAILREDNNPLTQAEKLAELFIEDRKKHIEEVVIPNLEKGHFVVSDRYKISTITYQGAQGIDIKELADKHDGLPIPDMTFVIDVSSQESGKRMKKEAGRNEHKFEANLDFLEKIRQNHFKAKEILQNEKIFIINGEQPPEKVFSDIKEIFEKEIKL